MMAYDGNLPLNNVISIKGGVASNVVIDSCICKVEEPEKLDEYLKNDPKVKFNKLSEDTFEFLGKSAHGIFR